MAFQNVAQWKERLSKMWYIYKEEKAHWPFLYLQAIVYFRIIFLEPQINVMALKISGFSLWLNVLSNKYCTWISHHGGKKYPCGWMLLGIAWLEEISNGIFFPPTVRYKKYWSSAYVDYPLWNLYPYIQECNDINSLLSCNKSYWA